MVLNLGELQDQNYVQGLFYTALCLSINNILISEQ